VDAVAQYHEADSEILGGGMQYFAKFPASCHHPVEDAIYGALKVRAPAAAEKAGCVGKHERIVEQVGEFAMMTRNLFLDAPKWRVPFCATARGFITLKREHIREEEKVFFPLALDHLTAEDWAAVDRGARLQERAWSSRQRVCSSAVKASISAR
jgi:hemerythrin-like domain-containing protein